MIIANRGYKTGVTRLIVTAKLLNRVEEKTIKGGIASFWSSSISLFEKRYKIPIA